VRNEALRDGVAALGATVIAPGGLREHGPFDVILELVGAPNLADNLEALETAAGSCDRHRRRRDGRARPAGADVQARRIHGSTLRARPLEEKALTARRMERSVLPLLAESAP
jgi:NADPH2:quinone reductase